MLTYEPDLSSLGGPADADEITARALELEKKSVFLEGLSRRLNTLGMTCSPDDTELILDEVRRRYKALLGINCPRTVAEWVRGTTPGVSNRRNNYELCLALEMDAEQTSEFFRHYFLTLPWGCKSRIDAVFLYCIYHRKPYSTAVKMLDESKGFVPQENAHTVTSQIFRTIISADDDVAFLDYLSSHCYSSEQQFLTARAKIIGETAAAKENYTAKEYNSNFSPERLNSALLGDILGFRYQQEDGEPLRVLPKRYTVSLPNDVTLGRILNGEKASYETLRKTLMLLRFYNFYSGAINDEKTISANLLDFCDELNGQLDLAGFAPIYLGHPFDYILMSCANTLEPIVTLSDVNERN